MKLQLFLLISLLAVNPHTFAFSPYENYLSTGKETHVGLIANILPEAIEAFTASIKKCKTEPIQSQLKVAGIRDVQAFTRKINGTTYAAIYFGYQGGLQYLGAAEAFENATKGVDWQASTTPHPRAKTYQRHWLQMEWINFIHGYHAEHEPTSTLMIGTTVIPEKEQQYRTLHQTVWPGVVDQVVRGKIRNLNVFLVEVDDKLVEFLYLEYMGTDQEADDRMNKADPINQRWWKLTDACQQPFSDVTEGIWAPLESIE